MPDDTSTRTPSYRHHKPSGRAVTTIGGRDYYLGKWQSKQSKQEYDRLIAEWLANGRSLPVVTRYVGTKGSLSIAELILAYIRHSRGYYVKDGKQTSEFDCIKYAMNHLQRLYSRTPASAFGPLALKAVRDAMIESGWCRKTVNESIGRIKRMFRWATENEMVPPSVYHGLLAVSTLHKGRSEVREGQPVRPVADTDVDAIQPFISPQAWAVVQLMRWTGARCGEIVQMRGIDLDVSGKVWLYRPASHKTQHFGRDRVIEIGPRGQEVIRQCLKTDPTAYLFSPAEAEDARQAERSRQRKTPLYPSHRRRNMSVRKRNPKTKPGPCYDTAAVRRAIARACDQAFPHPHLAGLDEAKMTDEQRAEIEKWKEEHKVELAEWQKDHRWHPHQLRHSFATRIRKEFGIETARVLLGHSSAVTSELYAEVDRQKVAEIIARVG